MDPNAPYNKQVELYQTLLELLKAEEICRECLRESEEEVSDKEIIRNNSQTDKWNNFILHWD